MCVTAARMVTDIAAETQCRLVAIVKPDSMVCETFRKYFGGDVYRDMSMEILGQLTQGKMPSVLGMLSMYSTWTTMFTAPFHIDADVMASSEAEKESREAAGQEALPAPHSAADTSGAFMQGGLIVLNGEGSIVWSYRGTTLGDYGTHSKIRAKVMSLKSELGY